MAQQSANAEVACLQAFLTLLVATMALQGGRPLFPTATLWLPVCGIYNL